MTEEEGREKKLEMLKNLKEKIIHLIRRTLNIPCSNQDVFSISYENPKEISMSPISWKCDCVIRLCKFIQKKNIKVLTFYYSLSVSLPTTVLWIYI